MGSNVGAVTPAPEMVAMADKIMDRYALHNDRERTLVHDAALTAIMETTTAAAECAYETCAKTRHVKLGHKAKTAIRNGEHLR